MKEDWTHVENCAPGDLVAVDFVTHSVLVESVGLNVTEPELKQVLIGASHDGHTNERMDLRQQLVDLQFVAINVRR